MFMKSFCSFAEGMKALMALSFSLADVFGQRCDIQPRGLDVADERSVRAWLGACAEYRGTGNGVGWDIQYYGSPFGAAYRTKAGLTFGWQYFPGTNGEGSDEPVFFIDRPRAKELPEGGSSLYAAVEAAGWTAIDMALANPYREGRLCAMATKVGWQPAQVPVEA